MVLSAKELSTTIRQGVECDPKGIAVVPIPDLEEIERSGEASVSLRLGRWFLELRQSNEASIDLTIAGNDKENRLSKKRFVPFGTDFVLHPNRFVLASTLEWIKLPSRYAAFVVGKSTLGRRGIIIETAAGVHPGFSGCLTLEVANVGEIPVRLIPGMTICQLFFHGVQGELGKSATGLAGQRKPRLGQIRPDNILEKLISSKR